MQKFFITLTFVLFFLFSGHIPSSPNIKAESLYLEMANVQSAKAKEIFLGLSSDQKREVWKHRLNSIDVEGLNNEQISFIKSVIQNLDRLKFDGSDAEMTSAAYNRAKKLFDKDQLKDYFSNLGRPKIGMISIAYQPDCECSPSEDFCGSTTIPWHCVGTTEFHCNTSQYGCGFLWTGRCYGMCSGAYVP